MPIPSDVMLQNQYGHIFASVKSMFCRPNPSSCLINNIMSAVRRCRTNKYEQQQQKKKTNRK